MFYNLTIITMPKPREYYTDQNGVLWLKCWDCLEFKTKNDFYKTTWSLFNLTSKCKSCMSKRTKERCRNNPDKRAKKSKRYRENNRERIKVMKKEWTDEWNKKHWFNIKTFHIKATRWIKKYNIYPDRCPICWEIKKMEFHHTSYKSLDMRCIWVICCKQCHFKIHCWEIWCPTPINITEALCQYQDNNARLQSE